MNVPKEIKLPGDALSEEPVNNNNAYIINPIFGKEYLTINETLNCINHLSAVLLADECYRGNQENKKYL